MITAFGDQDQLRVKAVQPSRIKPTQLCNQSITNTIKLARERDRIINMRTYDQVVTYWPDHAAVYNKIKVWYRNNAKFGKFYWQTQRRSYLRKRSFAQNIFATSPNVLILRFLKKTHICYGDFWPKNVYATAGPSKCRRKRFDKYNDIGRFELTIDL